MNQSRKSFRFYLSTLLTFVLVIGLFMWVNMEFKEQIAAKGSYTTHYGFPFSAITCHYEYGRGMESARYAGWSMSLLGMAGDLLVLASMLGWIYWLGEIRREPHTRTKPYRKAAPSCLSGSQELRASSQ